MATVVISFVLLVTSAAVHLRGVACSLKGPDPISDSIRRSYQLSHGKPVERTNEIKGYILSSVRSTGFPWPLSGSWDWVRK